MMKQRVWAVMVAVLLLAAGCTAKGSGGAPALASSICPVSTKGITERAAKVVATYGRTHCSDALAALTKPPYPDIPFANGRAVSVDGCLIEGDKDHHRVVPGTQYCFVPIPNAGGNVIAAVAVRDATSATKSPGEIHPVFFAIPESRNEYFWIYSPRGGAYGDPSQPDSGSYSVVRVRAVPQGDNFVQKVYLPRSNGKWEAHNGRLTVNDATLKQYAKDLRRFLAPHDPKA